MTRGERSECRREMTNAERDRARQPERSARDDRRRSHRLLGFLEVGQQLHAALVERLAALGQREPARRPVEESRVEMRLEVGDVARNRRRRQLEPGGRTGETALLDHVGEYR